MKQDLIPATGACARAAVFGRIAVAVLPALWVAACAGPGVATPVVHVTITPNGLAECRGRVVALPRLPDLVRQNGGGRQTRIEVTLPPDGASLMPGIVQVLAKGGYRKTVFITPRQASSYAGAKAPPGNVVPPPR